MPFNSFPEKSFLAALQIQLPAALPQFLLQQRWFGGKARPIHSVEISDIVPFTTVNAYLILAAGQLRHRPRGNLRHPPCSGLESKARLHR